jgi:signal transduction histidine kinase
MLHSQPEPGFYSVFRFYAVLRLLAFLFIPLAALVTGMNWETPVNWVVVASFSISQSLVLLALLYWRWLEHRLGGWYIPLLLGIATLGLLVDQQLMSSRQGMAESGFMFILLILVAWQYSFRTVIAYTLGVGLVEAVLNFFLPTTILFVTSLPGAEWVMILGFLAARSVAYLLLGYIVNRLASAQRVQRHELAEANRKLVSHAEMLEQLATSRERLRLSRELHDTLAHTLSALAVEADALQTVWEPAPPRAKAMLMQIASSTRSGLDETRRALRALRAAPLEELGLVEALCLLAQDCAARGNWKLELDLPETLEALPPDVEQCFYRVAQEALENAVRHAKPSRVCLELTGSAFTLLLKVTDDGAGFDPRRGGGEDSLGLQGMRERAELIGAKLEIQSQPGKGAQLFLDWEAGEV